ncbi:MAG: substrate-binding domain-containing protein [Planctomycetaceae bacterium]
MASCTRRWFLILTITAVTSGCGTSPPPAGSGSTTGGGPAEGNPAADSVKGTPAKKFRIAMIPKGATHDFWLSVRAGAQKAADELGTVQILWDAPISESDKDVQVNLVDGFINDQVDAICLAPIDREGMVPVVRRAKDAGIPTLIFDSALADPSLSISYVATDNYHGGVLAGEHMVKLLNGKGNVILLRYQEGSESTEQREQAFLDTIKKSPEIVVISDEQRVTTDSVEAVRVSSSLLVTHGDNVNGVFTVCESLNKGMLKALQDKQLAGKVRFIAFDSDPQLVDAMKNGQIDGIVLQDPVRMGYDSVKTMVAHLEGKPVEKLIPTGEALATPENMSEPRMQELLFPAKYRD